MLAEKFQYDVFLSYSSKDKPAVRELAEKLRSDSIRVWFDEWEIKLGDSIPSKIEQGLEQSRVLILAMSENAFASEWVALERHTALFRDPDNSERRFIPLLLEDCEIKPTIKQFRYTDWRNRDNEEYRQLYETVRPQDEIIKFKPKSDKPTVTLQFNEILEGHNREIHSLSVSSNGKFIISGSDDRTVRVWDRATGECLAVLEGHTRSVSAVAITADGKFIISGSRDEVVRVWDRATGECLAVLEGHTHFIQAVAITPDGKFIISGSRDKSVRIWDRATGECLAVLEGHTHFVYGVAITANGDFIVSGSFDKSVRIWDRATGECLAVLEGHADFIHGVAITPNGDFIVSSSRDKSVRVWDRATGKCLAVLEGHTDFVYALAITPNGDFIVSGSRDKSVRVWDRATGECLAILEGHTRSVSAVAITADANLVISGSHDTTLRMCDLPSFNKDEGKVKSNIPQTLEQTAIYYTNAKVLLVGDSGVGKSGLAHRLTQNKFVETSSTDGVWATQMSLPHDVNTADTEREIWLWDFAGQEDYRLIHRLFMNETALAVLVFNPQDSNPFEGLGEWDSDIQRAATRPFNKLLVAGRCDVGGLIANQRSLDEFIEDRKFVKYLETSAKSGTGCEELRRAIIENINWDDIPHTASPRIFKLLKQEIIRLKDEGKVLMRVAELKQQLEMRLVGERFNVDELRAVIGLLSNSGVVWELEFADFVLLQPERINSYAAAVIRTVRASPDEMGYITEEDILAGNLKFEKMERLPPDEEEVVLRAMLQIFVKRGLCLRETSVAGTLLIFPSYFKRDRPEQSEHPADFATYRFSGALDEIYATLVVRLHHTNLFKKDRLWRYAADFKTMVRGKTLGLKMEKKGEGAAEIIVYLEPDISDETKVTFSRFIHDFLRAKDAEMRRERHYACPKCFEAVGNPRVVRLLLEKGSEDIVCQICETRVTLWDSIEEMFASEEMKAHVRRLDEKSRLTTDNESKEMLLEAHAHFVTAEAGQIFRGYTKSDWGFDGEIEFKNYDGNASGKKVYLQLKSGDSYLRARKRDEREIFDVKPRHAEYWLAHNYDVMLVIRTSGGDIRWMNATEYLRKHGKETRQIVFDGEPFVWQSVIRLRDKLIPMPVELRQ